MKELLETIVKNLVDKKEDVNIVELNSEDKIIFKIEVASDDIGKIIGKKGKTITAIRNIVKASSNYSSKRIFVEIL